MHTVDSGLGAMGWYTERGAQRPSEVLQCHALRSFFRADAAHQPGGPAAVFTDTVATSGHRARSAGCAQASALDFRTLRPR
jgi:hypothetical protein